MDTRMIIALFSSLVLIAVGIFVVTSMRAPVSEPATGEQTSEPTDPATTTPESADAYSNITRVTAKHFFDGTTHTLVGEIPMPTPCDLLETDHRIQESYPEQVTLQFSVRNEADMCAQVITPQRFLIEVDAAEEATFAAELEGRSVELNLLEPAPGESPDDFELYIKG